MGLGTRLGGAPEANPHWAIPLFNRTPLWMTINGVQGGIGIYVPGGGGEEEDTQEACPGGCLHACPGGRKLVLHGGCLHACLGGEIFIITCPWGLFKCLSWGER